MSMESDLVTLLKLQCVRTFPDFAPINTVRPYITYHHVGGRSLRWLDKTAADKRQSLVQINVWADTRSAALVLARAIEDAMCASAAFSAMPVEEPIATAEPDFNRYGTIQDFQIIALR
jgi:hypothetical protein